MDHGTPCCPLDVRGIKDFSMTTEEPLDPWSSWGVCFGFSLRTLEGHSMEARGALGSLFRTRFRLRSRIRFDAAGGW